MENQVSDQKKTERSNLLMALDRENREKYEDARKGREDEVLFEELVTLDGEAFYTGHTKEYRKLAILAEEDYTNRILKVRVGDERKQGILICTKF